jgi:hypothetical protein
LDIYGNKINENSRKRRIPVNGSLSSYRPLAIEEKTKVRKRKIKNKQLDEMSPRKIYFNLFDL